MVRVSLLIIFLLNSLPAMASITVYAASSLTDVLNRVVHQYQEKTGEKVRVSYASSSSLARQIEHGAPADIYLSANTKWMDYLAKKDRIEKESLVNIAKNQLVLIGSQSTPKHNTWQWFANHHDFRLAIADPNHVPAGIYAKQSLVSLNLWSTLNKRTVSANNVRAALLFVERDEAPLGIVYRTDALRSKNVNIIQVFPEESHDAIIYPMAILNGQNRQAVMDFYQYMLSEETKAILMEYGFSNDVK